MIPPARWSDGIQTQCLDLIFQNGSRYAVVEAKHGKYLSLLKAYKGGLRQGSLDYYISRPDRYLRRGDGTHNALARQLLNEADIGQLESFGTSIEEVKFWSCQLVGQKFLQFPGELNYGNDDI